jgi:hypothetical protein
MSEQTMGARGHLPTENDQRGTSLGTPTAEAHTTKTKTTRATQQHISYNCTPTNTTTQTQIDDITTH